MLPRGEGKSSPPSARRQWFAEAREQTVRQAVQPSCDPTEPGHPAARCQLSNIKRRSGRARCVLQRHGRFALDSLIETRIVPAKQLKDSDHFDIG
jgi:hypothetical protein